LQCAQARLDGGYRRMSQCWWYLHWLYDAGIPGQVHALHGLYPASDLPIFAV